MDDLIKQLTEQLSGDDLSQISQQIGADKGTTGSSLSAAMPLLMSALANNASKPDEAESLHQALVEDHDGSILNELFNLVLHQVNSQNPLGDGLLHVFLRYL